LKKVAIFGLEVAVFSKWYKLALRLLLTKVSYTC